MTHRHDLGNDCLVGPFNTENLGELLQVLGRSLTDGENSVTELAHTQTAELLVEELDAELRGKKGNVFVDLLISGVEPHRLILVNCGRRG